MDPGAEFRDAETWSAGLREYEKKRHANVAPIPVERVTAYEKSREQAAFNPVLQKYTDQRKEQQFQATNATEKTKKTNASYDNQFKYETKYDIVTHVDRNIDERKKNELDPIPRKTPVRQAPNARGFDIISHRQHGQEGAVEDRGLDRLSGVARKKGTLEPTGASRDYNIISNKYVSDDVAKKEVDREVASQHQRESFWKQNQFDPVLGKYHDASRDRSEAQRQAELDTRRREQAARGQPQAMRRGEAAAFDIVSGQVRDEAALRALEANKGRPGIRTQTEFSDTRMREEMFKRQELEENRQRGRIDPGRYTIEMERGYNPITQQPFEGVGSHPPAPLRTHERVSPWDRCEQVAQKK